MNLSDSVRDTKPYFERHRPADLCPKCGDFIGFRDGRPEWVDGESGHSVYRMPDKLRFTCRTCGYHRDIEPADAP